MTGRKMNNIGSAIGFGNEDVQEDIQDIIKSLDLIGQEKYQEVPAGQTPLGQAVKALAEKILAREEATFEERVSKTQSVALSINNMVDDITTLSSRALNITDISKTAGEAASEGAKTIGEALENMTNISKAVGDSSSKVDQLAQASTEIGGIVKSIEEIASQTNLLALNATIEAARAGEAGRGFAVVASEVKTLANQTASATEDIRTRISRLTTEMEEIMQAMSGVSNAVATGQSSIESANEKISDIHENINSVNDDFYEINQIIDNQKNASQQIAATVASFSKDLGQD